jgi:hypothetical protein
VGLGWLLGDPPAKRIDWTPEAAVYGLLATIPLAATVWLCMRSRWGPFRRLLEFMEKNVNPLLANCRLWEFAGIAVFAGFGEEMLFRGVLQNLPSNLFEGQAYTYVGLVLASVLFGLLHWLTLTYAILAALIGLYLGILWIATGNLLVPAVVHAVYDFWALVYLLRLSGRSRPSP